METFLFSGVLQLELSNCHGDGDLSCMDARTFCQRKSSYEHVAWPETAHRYTGLINASVIEKWDLQVLLTPVTRI